MSEKVDLQQLRERLAKLGVHIDAPTSTSPPRRPPAAIKHTVGVQAAGTSWEAHLDRSSKEVAKLLERCSKVHQALTDSEAAAEKPAQAHQQLPQPQQPSAATKAAAALAAAAAAAKAGRAAATATGKRPAAVDGRPASSSGLASAKTAAVAAAAAATKSSPAKDSKLLVRAAQRLLRDAQAEAEQVDRALTAAAAAPAITQPAAAAAAKANGTAAERGSPLATVLAQYKEAQASWAQEKAKLRREAVANRKKASKLELEMAKLQRLHQHKSLDVSSLRAALKGRDLQLEEAHARNKQLEAALAASQEVAAEKLCSLAAERDDLQALLLATLQRLEGVEAVVAAADATSAAMEDKVRVLEGEREAALQLASAAKAEVAQLQEAQRRLQWQSQLLEKMSEVQLRHNKRKSAAIKELLSTAAATEPAQHASHSIRAAAKQQRSPGNPSEVLQGLLDELLANNDADGVDDGGGGGRDGFADDSTIASD